MVGVMWLLAVVTSLADELPHSSHSKTDGNSQVHACTSTTRDQDSQDRFDGIQVETADIVLFEQFFETILQAPVVQRADHPAADRLRGYCYRGVLVVVRQDLRRVRPAGWVQLNFRVPDVKALQAELERKYQQSTVAQLAEAEREKIIRFRYKPDVMRGNRQVARFEVAGPEGFMIGFDQAK